jgi:hypothetical protein
MSITKIRQYKILGLSIFDIITSILGMIILFLLMWKWHFSELNPWNFVVAGILLAIPVGIVFHVIFGVNTTLNSRLGLSRKPVS